MRNSIMAVLAASTALLGVMAAAPTASAEPDPPNCPKGYFCAWQGPDRTGTQIVRTAGNWSGFAWYQSWFNNGYASPGADHVGLGYNYQGGTGTLCVHFNPGPGDYKGTVGPGAAITSVTWRGEC